MEFLIAAGGVGLAIGVLASALVGWLRRRQRPRPAPVEPEPDLQQRGRPAPKRPAPVKPESDEHGWLIKRKHLHDDKPCLEMYCPHCSETKHNPE